jgi:hypothetical protein
MPTEQNKSRELTSSESVITLAVGIVMLVLSFLAFIATFALYLPFHRLIEGLSK